VPLSNTRLLIILQVCYNVIMNGSQAIISFIIGGYAAIVATTALVWNILKERSKIRLKVIDFGEFESETDTGELKTEEKLRLSIINASYKPVTIKKVGFHYGSDNEDWYELDDPVCKRLNLRKGLSAGDSQIWAIPMEYIKERAKSEAVEYIFVEDGRYKRYKMRIPKYVLEE
jgi:hypothetical protein